MCIPALLPFLATGLAGGLQYLGQQKADHAMTNTFNRERARQKDFEAQQNADFEDSLKSTQDVTDPTAQAAATAKRGAVLMSATKSAAPSSGGYLPGAKSASPVVNAHAVAAGQTSDAHTATLGQALAALGGVGDLMQQNDIRIGHNSQDIGQIGGFKRGSLNVLQAEMDAAKQKGATLRAIGALGQQLGMAALSGGTSAAAGGAGLGTAMLAI